MLEHRVTKVAFYWYMLEQRVPNRIMVPITGRARSFLLVFKKQNREEGETE